MAVGEILTRHDYKKIVLSTLCRWGVCRLSEFHSLFTYGTLQDPELQEILMGSRLDMRRGVLIGWGLRINSSGYFFAVEDSSSKIEGHIVQLTREQLFVADQWEDIPYYRRVLVPIVLDNGDTRDSWLYVQNHRSDKGIPISGFSANDRSSVLQEAAIFKRQIDATSWPEADVYLHVPCRMESVRSIAPVDDPSLFIETMNRTSSEEFSDTLNTKVVRVCLGDTSLVVVDSTSSGNQTTFTHRSCVYLTSHESTRYAVVTIVLPLCAIPLAILLENVSSEKLYIQEGRDSLSLANWLEQRHLLSQGTIKSTIFCSRMLDRREDLMMLLACEWIRDNTLISRPLVKAAEENIAQYTSAEIYASERALVEFPKEFNDLWEERLVRQSLTLFIVELLVFRDAAINAANNTILFHLERQDLFNTRDAFKWIEDLGQEFSQAITFWNVRNFRFLTAQLLADGISEAFHMEHQMVKYESNKSIFEQLVSVHSSRLQDKENRTINWLLMTLATVQTIPIVYSGVRATIFNGWKEIQPTAAAASFLPWVVIWFVFVYRKRQKGNVG